MAESNFLMNAVYSSSAIVTHGIIETYAHSQTTVYDKDDWTWYNTQPIDENIHAPIYRSLNEWTDQYLWIRKNVQNAHYQSIPIVYYLSPYDTKMGFMCQKIVNKLPYY